MKSETTIIVVGGGIGGVTAATAIAQVGLKVILLEAAPQFGEIGAGVTLSPNAMKGLDFIGVCEEVAAAGVEPTKQRIQSHVDGATLVVKQRTSQREIYGAPYVTIHRADLHAILVEAAIKAGVDMRCNSPVVSTEGTTVILADGSRVTGDAIVGADGVKSVVRQRFESKPPVFTGHVAWRAIVPASDELRDLIDFPGVIIGPGRMITRYVVRGGEWMNLVFFAREQGWEQEGWTIRTSPEELAATYEGWCEDAQKLIRAASEQPLFKWAINARTPLEDWVVDGNVTLLGDAAHAMTPFLGHGAATAIEDAVVLARALQASETVSEAFRRYTDARHERASFIQMESNANAERMQADENSGFKANSDEEGLGLFKYDCRTVEV